MLKDNKKIFTNLLVNTMLASITNMFVWFALTFWVYLQTQSVLTTSWIAGSFAVANMAFAFLFGNIVDHHKKRFSMLLSSFISLIAYSIGAIIFFTNPLEVFTSHSSPMLWILIVCLMLGTVAGNLRMIALSTLVTLLFKDNRDKANGMVGTVNGLSFTITGALSGLVIGFFGMKTVIITAVVATFICLVHLMFVKFEEKENVRNPEETGMKRHFDFKAAFSTILLIQGLFTLIMFTTLNNFLGGIFMSLMDAYGLSLVSVKVWGVLFSILSLGFIFGNIYIAKYGLGKRPLRNLLIVNLIAWTTCIFFTIQPSIVLLAIGMFIWMTVSPFAETAEQTVIQAVVPYEKQGRIFGFAQSIESAATPVTAFLIGPIAQFIFIPYMTTGKGVQLIGDWFGTGPDRGIALLFTLAGMIGVVITLFAMRSKAFKILSVRYSESI